ncbi:MAG TPA: hypothetical protein VF901_08590, partial [Bradyrhizobium sp.]
LTRAKDRLQSTRNSPPRFAGRRRGPALQSSLTRAAIFGAHIEHGQVDGARLVLCTMAAGELFRPGDGTAAGTRKNLRS